MLKGAGTQVQGTCGARVSEKEVERQQRPSRRRDAPTADEFRAQLRLHTQWIDAGSSIACAKAPDDEWQAGERTCQFEVQSITPLDRKIGLTLPIIAPSPSPRGQKSRY
jgi:hypothetical protein